MEGGQAQLLQFELSDAHIETICTNWDKDFIKKLKTENKLEQFINFIKTKPYCANIINEIYLYFYMKETNYPLSTIVNYHRNKAYTYLSQFIYNLSYIFTETELNEEGISKTEEQSWDASNYWLMLNIYNTKRHQVMNQPFLIEKLGQPILVYPAKPVKDFEDYDTTF